jgi:acyl-CoA thioester hydrolase
MSTTHQYDLQVKKEHLDELHHVNNVQYLKWVQEIAGAHWKALIEKETDSFGTWVVRSHKIDYKRPAKQNDWLTLKTYVAHTEGFLSQRVVKIYFKDTSTLVAQCNTQWCYLNATTHKLEPIPEKVFQLFH